MKHQYKTVRMMSLLGLAISVASFAASAQTVRINDVPPCGAGGPDASAMIAGTTRGADSTSQSVVLFAYGDQWYVQPYVAAPLTSIGRDGSWRTHTHLGLKYAALLVEASYDPPSTTFVLPKAGGAVLDVNVVDCGAR